MEKVLGIGVCREREGGEGGGGGGGSCAVGSLGLSLLKIIFVWITVWNQLLVILDGFSRGLMKFFLNYFPNHFSVDI